MENNAVRGQTRGELAEQAFGRNVRTMRVASGMTQADLAEKMTLAGANMRQGMIAKMERGARPTSVAEVATLAAILGVPPSALLATDESVPKDVTTLLDMRMNALQEAGALQGLLTERERLEERIALKRSRLASSVALFDKTLAIVVENRGADWVREQGLLAAPLADQDEVFVVLGGYGEGTGPTDEYVLSQLRGQLHGVDSEAG